MSEIAVLPTGYSQWRHEPPHGLLMNNLPQLPPLLCFILRHCFFKPRKHYCNKKKNSFFLCEIQSIVCIFKLCELCREVCCSEIPGETLPVLRGRFFDKQLVSHNFLYFASGTASVSTTHLAPMFHDLCRAQVPYPEIGDVNFKCTL